MQNIPRSIFRWLPAVAVMAGIFYLSSTRGVGEVLPSDMTNTSYDFIISTIAHLCVYGLLALTLEFGFGVNDRRSRIWIMLIVLLYGLSDEFHQSFVSGRMANLLDVAFDLLGSALVTFRAVLLPRVFDKNTGQD